MSVSIGVRLHAPVHVAGGRVHASVTVCCSGAAPRAPLSFVTAQVSGRWTADPAWVAPSAHRAATPDDALDLHVYPREAPWDTVLDDANRVGGGGRPGYGGLIFRSAPLAVCIDEPVPASGSTSFHVQCVLPDMLPPTLRGTALRYSYTFIIAAAMAGASSPQFVRVPFRVVTPEAVRHDLVIPVPTPRRSGPSPSRFLEEAPAYALSMSALLEKPPPSDDIDIALARSPNGRLTSYGRDEDLWKGSVQHEDETPLNFMRYVPPSPKTPVSAVASAAASPRSGAQPSLSAVQDLPLISQQRTRSAGALPMYQISRGAVSLARMYLPKRVHHLGDTLTAVFDFLDGDTRCYRLNARLECQEIVQPKYALGTKHTSAGSQGIIFRKVYGEHGEFVMHSRNTHVTFSIPHDAPVSFRTSAVHVRWLVHFVFLIPKSAERSTRSSASDGADCGQSHDRIQRRENGTHRSGEHEDETNAGQGEETTALLANVTVHDNGDTGEDAGNMSRRWEGGDWRGDDPISAKFLPVADTDALQWTLPLTVTSSPRSTWGPCTQSLLRLLC